MLTEGERNNSDERTSAGLELDEIPTEDEQLHASEPFLMHQATQSIDADRLFEAFGIEMDQFYWWNEQQIDLGPETEEVPNHRLDEEEQYVYPLSPQQSDQCAPTAEMQNWLTRQTEEQEQITDIASSFRGRDPVDITGFEYNNLRTRGNRADSNETIDAPIDNEHPIPHPPSPADSAAPFQAVHENFDNHACQPETPKKQLATPSCSTPIPCLLDAEVFGEMYKTMSQEELRAFHAWLDDPNTITMPEEVAASLDQHMCQISTVQDSPEISTHAPSTPSRSPCPPTGIFSPTPSKRRRFSGTSTSSNTGTPRGKKNWMTLPQRAWLVNFYNTRGYRPQAEVAKLFLSAFPNVTQSVKTIVNACSRGPVLEARKRAELCRVRQNFDLLTRFTPEEDVWICDFYRKHGYRPVPEVWTAYTETFGKKKMRFFNFAMQLRHGVALQARKQAEFNAIRDSSPMKGTFNSPKYQFSYEQTQWLVNLFTYHAGERELSVVTATDAFQKAFPDSQKSAYAIKIECSRSPVLEARNKMKERYPSMSKEEVKERQKEYSRRQRVKQATREGRKFVPKGRAGSVCSNFSAEATPSKRRVAEAFEGDKERYRMSFDFDFDGEGLGHEGESEGDSEGSLAAI
jgi:hypothetical protein